jgi:hypothetical protein
MERIGQLVADLINQNVDIGDAFQGGKKQFELESAS